MSREIQFRAWDIGHKRMLIPAMPLIGGGLSWGKTGYDAGGRDYILEQFTGLRDKNGKEIYEGDIISMDELSPRYNKVVIYKLSSFGYADCGVHVVPEFGKWRIIGNIHENPELLEASK